MANNYDHLFKILIIGDSGCGKSSLLLRYADLTFNASYITTIGVDFKIKTIEIDGAKVKLQIWDTAGQERFRTITATYYRGAHGIMIVYDITSKLTFESVRRWHHEISSNLSSVPTLLIGNKVDCESNRQVQTLDGENYSKETNIPFFETSAKADINVTEAFEKLARMVLNIKLETMNQNVKHDLVNVKPAAKKKKKFC